MMSVSTTSGMAEETPHLIASDKVGSIKRVMIEKVSGRVAYAVMSFGGFLGMGVKYYPLPWSVLRYDPRLDAYELNLSDEQLQGAPSITESDIAEDRIHEREIDAYYGPGPFWF